MTCPFWQSGCIRRLIGASDRLKDLTRFKLQLRHTLHAGATGFSMEFWASAPSTHSPQAPVVGLGEFQKRDSFATQLHRPSCSDLRGAWAQQRAGPRPGTLGLVISIRQLVGWRNEAWSQILAHVPPTMKGLSLFVFRVACQSKHLLLTGEKGMTMPVTR